MMPAGWFATGGDAVIPLDLSEYLVVGSPDLRYLVSDAPTPPGLSVLVFPRSAPARVALMRLSAAAETRLYGVARGEGIARVIVGTGRADPISGRFDAFREVGPDEELPDLVRRAAGR